MKQIVLQILLQLDPVSLKSFNIKYKYDFELSQHLKNKLFFDKKYQKSKNADGVYFVYLLPA